MKWFAVPHKQRICGQLAFSRLIAVKQAVGYTFGTKAGGERLFSVQSRAALINYLSALCDELDRVWLDNIGKEVQARAKANPLTNQHEN